MRQRDTPLPVDESSMIPIPDLVALAEARNAKMVPAGDTGQLQAVENGGAISMLAVALGYVLLADPVQARSGQPRCGLARPAWK
jgi:ATP-dependent exoDNAse (exonuclease V) alpha subunit